MLRDGRMAGLVKLHRGNGDPDQGRLRAASVGSAKGLPRAITVDFSAAHARQRLGVDDLHAPLCSLRDRVAGPVGWIELQPEVLRLPRLMTLDVAQPHFP